MKILIDVNQYSLTDVPRAHELHADGIWCESGNSPGIVGKELRLLIDRISNDLIVTCEGGIDIHQLLEDPNWTGAPPQINQNRKRILECGRKPSRAMIYYEFSDINVHNVTLTPHELGKAWDLEGQTPILPLCRQWVGADKVRAQNALKMTPNKIPGLCFELAANVPLIKNQAIVRGIRAVHALNREVWILLSPFNGSLNFEGDVRATLTYLKARLSSTIWSKLFLVLAVYELEVKHTSFFGPTNSMIEALKVARTFK